MADQAYILVIVVFFVYVPEKLKYTMILFSSSEFLAQFSTLRVFRVGL